MRSPKRRRIDLRGVRAYIFVICSVRICYWSATALSCVSSLRLGSEWEAHREIYSFRSQ